MDNLSLQICPLEVSRLPSSPGQLSCLLKKIAISTGHTLEKHTLIGVEATQGTVLFPNGPTLSLSKELQLHNTKLSLHFMSKQARKVSCIGSAEIDLGCLPPNPRTKLTCPLANSVHPHAALSFELKCNDTRPLPKAPKRKPEEMNILFTEGQIKEELMTRRRKDPNIPTAYEISRKNYKHLEIHREDPRTNQSRNPTSHPRKPSPSSSSIPYSHKNSSKGYQQRYAGKTSSSKGIEEDSPAPRNKTPEPIRPTGYRKQKTEQSTWEQRQQGSGESRQEPSRLQVRPYQEYSSVGSEGEGAIREHWDSTEPHFSEQSSSLKQGKYLDITEKLQSIQDKLTGFQANQFRTDQRHQHQQELQKEHPKPGQSFLPKPFQPTFEHQATLSSVRTQQMHSTLTNPLESTFTEDPSPPEEELTTFRQQNREDNGNRSNRGASAQDEVRLKGREGGQERVLNQQLEDQNRELSRQNQILKASSLEAESTLKKLMSELEEVIKSKRQLEGQNSKLQAALKGQEQRLQSQSSLLQKMTFQYQEKGDEIEALKEQLASKGSLQEKDTEWQIKATQAESNLRIKQNELRHLKLEMGNLQAEKRQLEMEVQALATNNSTQMSRQKSLAHIQQISSNSLASVTQRENQSLRTEVKILQDRLSSLNSMLQSLLQGEELALEREGEADREREGQREARRVLEMRCSALEEELRAKKNLMAEMVNLVWSQGDASLMERIQKFIEDEENK